jgi:heme-degrading monooxygenase HmoA
MTVYTLGVWRVKPGCEDDFVASWDALAQWTLDRGFDTHGTLVRDRSDPQRFVSFGPWRSVEDTERWRAEPEFQERVARLEALLESFEPGTYDVVMRVS